MIDLLLLFCWFYPFCFLFLKVVLAGEWSLTGWHLHQWFHCTKTKSKNKTGPWRLTDVRVVLKDL